MQQPSWTEGRDWFALGAALAIGLWECAALARARLATALRAAAAHAPMKRRR